MVLIGQFKNRNTGLYTSIYFCDNFRIGQFKNSNSIAYKRAHNLESILYIFLN